MPARIIGAHKRTDGYHFQVHLDTEKVVPDPDREGDFVPDPAWVHDIHFGPLQPSLLPLHENGGHNEKGEFLHACTTQHGRDLTEEEYLENLETQVWHQAELELHRRNGTSHHEATREVLKRFLGRELN